MKISIITVCFNSEETIRDTIESVINQTYQNIEYIVVDGASKDGTLSIIAEYKSRISSLVSEPDMGIYDAMNKGVKLATGDFVGILNSDDLFADSDIVNDLVCFLESNPDVDGCYGDLVYVKRNNVDVITRKFSSKIFSAKTIRFGIMCPHPTFYIKRALYNQLGLYDTTFPVAADFDLIARFVCHGVRLKRFPRIIVKMREGGISTSGFSQRMTQNFELIRACKQNGIYTNIILIGLKVPYKLWGYLGYLRSSRQARPQHGDSKHN